MRLISVWILLCCLPVAQATSQSDHTLNTKSDKEVIEIKSRIAFDKYYTYLLKEGEKKKETSPYFDSLLNKALEFAKTTKLDTQETKLLLLKEQTGKLQTKQRVILLNSILLRLKDEDLIQKILSKAIRIQLRNNIFLTPDSLVLSHLDRQLLDPVRYDLLRYLGLFYRNQNRNDIGNKFFLAAIEIEKKPELDTALYAARVTYIYNLLGQSNYTEAIHYSKELEQIAERKENNEMLMWSNYLLSTVFSYLQNQVQAIRYLEKAIIYGEKANHPSKEHFQFILNLERFKDNPSDQNHKKLIGFWNDMIQQFPCEALWIDLGEAFIELENYESAIRFYDQIVSISKDCKSAFHSLQAYANKAAIFIQTGQYNKAELLFNNHLKGSISERKEFSDLDIKILSIAIKLSIFRGKITQAETYSKKLKKIKKKKEEKRLSAFELLTTELLEKRNELKRINMENTFLKEKNEIKNQLSIFIIISLLLLSLVSFTFYKRWLLLRKTHRELNKLQKEIQEVSLLFTQSLKTPLKFSNNTDLSYSANSNLLERTNTLLSTIKTQKKSLETLIKKAQKREADFKAFNFSVGHDLKMPLRNIMIISDDLQNLLKKHQVIDTWVAFEQIQQATKRAISLIDSLLHYTTIDNNKIYKELISITPLVKSTIQQLSNLQEEKETRFTIDCRHMVYADPFLLRQVMENVISNAIKYSQPVDAPYIHISTIQKESSTIISIKDNGIGIETDLNKQNLFQLFTSVHNRQIYEGHGIGLAIVKNIMEKHGGKAIIMSPGVNEGCQVNLYFPNKPN